jgi:hypothetical protein
MWRLRLYDQNDIREPLAKAPRNLLERAFNQDIELFRRHEQ